MTVHKEPSPLLTPAEVGKLFRVDGKTVWRWAKAGKLPYVKTPGGHKRYPAEAVYALLTNQRQETSQ